MFKRWMTHQWMSPGRFPGRVLLPLAWNRRNRILNEVTRVNLDVTAGDSILEVGTGGGFLIKQLIPLLSDGYLVGIDSVPRFVRRSQKMFRRQIDSGMLGIQCADVQKMPFPDGTFNKVCSVNSIFYWNDTVLGLKEISRVLQVSGILILTFTAAECLKDRFYLDHNHLFDRTSIVSLLENTGFHQIRCETHSDKHRQFHCCVASRRHP